MSTIDNSATVAEQFETMEQQQRANLAGMWLFLATEVLFFGGLFLGFTIYRVENPSTFAAAAGKLDLVLGTINTAILLTSGVTMSLADPAMLRRNRRWVLAMMAVTAALGVAFLVLKGAEYHKEFTEGLAPFPGLPFTFEGPHADRAQVFFGFYFALTGLHAAHMAIGIGAIMTVFIFVWRWRAPARLERQVRMTGLYWAFVDVVWLFVFPTLYLLRI